MDIRKLAVLLGGYEVDAGITTYYPLNEGSGVSIEDISQYGNHGTLKNGPVWTLESGEMGLTFDGADDYIEDSEGRHIVREGTTGFWSEVKIGDKTKIVGSGTKFYFSTAGTDLEGQFVSDFADYCTSLDHFYCNSNSFSGTLPSFNACTSLGTFYCYSNSFSGTLPSFNACTSLGTFYCYSNSFSGTLPSFNACTSLIDFYCYNNSFSGALPSFNACTSLGYFYCYSNSFSGALPSFNACTSLGYFYCYSNSFSGALPSFDACTSLVNFYCSSNSFSGYELGGFATQISLATLDMHDNAITAAADINAILADLVTSSSLGGRVGCTVNLEGGTNAAPTGQGATDKATLNAIEGWTVTTN